MAVTILAWAVAGTFLALACVAFGQWMASPRRDRFLIFAALATLGLIALTGVLQPLVHYRSRALADASLVTLLASVYAMLEFRHTVIALSRRARRIIAGLVVGLGVASLAVRFPLGRQPHLSPVQMVVGFGVFLLWLFALVEPAIRFRSAAKHRPPIERARLRLLAAGYGGVVAILAVDMVFQVQHHPALSTAMQAVALLTAPLFYVAVSPPRRLRERWVAEETSRERARLLLDLPVVVWTVDADMRLTSLTGGSVAENVAAMSWKGKRITDFYVAENAPDMADIDKEAIVAYHRLALAGERVSYELPSVGRIYQATLQPIRGADGSIAGAIGLATDITERYRTERAVEDALTRERAAADQLRAADEMKNAFLNAVSHELRTPLTSIQGFATTLRYLDVLDPRDREEIVERLIASSAKLSKLLGDLLDIDRLRLGLMEPRRRTVDLGELVEERARGWSAETGRSVSIDCARLSCAVDVAMIERVVENLMGNAAKHTPSDAHIWVRVRREDDTALIVVEDDGPGVPAPLAASIFEPFAQGHVPPHAPGVGIGLSLVARFAELHGGRAFVRPRDGGGASFRVELPVRTAAIDLPEALHGAPIAP